jgi:hypothetical protein
MVDLNYIRELIERFYTGNTDELCDVTRQFIEYLYRDGLDEELPNLITVETELSQMELDFISENKGRDYELLHMTYNSGIFGNYYIIKYNGNDTNYLILSIITTSKYNSNKLVLLDLDSLLENNRYDLQEFKIDIVI